ncbi:MFS transporter [Kitasatospora sp. HPMI-4]|uniref:MFS transporter n=1 Tax=Kitasatospora sp. HPMI-4 TaxID=3448443 RepID=UPI003F1ADD67
MATDDTARTVAGRAGLPRAYLVWLAGTRASLVGDAVLYFALGWAASAHGGGTGALVLTGITLPRTVLLLLGGAVGDRFGARRVMIAGDAVMLAVTVVLALAGLRLGPSPWLLLAVAAVVGTVDAFYLPASGSMPARLVAKPQLPRALAARQAGGQLASLLGAPLGAVLVSAAGLAGAAAVDAATFALVLVVLLRVRPAAGAEPPVREGRLLAAAADGVRLAVKDPVLRPALLLTAVAAGFLLPVASLLNPLLARERGWGAGATGLVAGGLSLGTLTVALVVARRGGVNRVGVGAAIGLCGAALGTAVLATAPTAAVAVAGGIAVGAGSGMFACHLSPLVLANVPATHLSRVQALLTLVQSLALVLANNALGALADSAGAVTATALCATAVCAAGVVGMASKPIRALRQERGQGRGEEQGQRQGEEQAVPGRPLRSDSRS